MLRYIIKSIMKLKILADANPVYSGRLTGVGYFTEQLLNSLSKQADIEGFAFNFKKRTHPKLGFGVQEKTNIPGKVLSYPRYLGIDVPLRTIFNTSRADIILGTNYLLPPTGRIPAVTTIHDMCFIDHPEWVQGRNAHILKKMLPKTLARVKGVITVSEFSASRLRDIYNYKGPVLVVNIPPRESSAGEKRPSLPTNIPKRFYLLVSTIEPRKNISTLLDAFELLPDELQRKYPLILAGKPGWDPEVLDRLYAKKNPNIYYLDYVSEEERNWLYKNALATIIPSHYEGFGMMALESLVAQTPCITSDIPALREILGKTGQYFQPDDKEELSKLMVQFTKAKFAEDVLAAQRKILSRYSWQDTAEDVINFCREITK